MCTGIVENTIVEGSGKGPKGWFSIDHASVSYDHPDHARSESAVIIDITNKAAGPESRIAIELTPESARNLVNAILSSISRGEGKAEPRLFDKLAGHDIRIDDHGFPTRRSSAE